MKLTVTRESYGTHKQQRLLKLTATTKLEWLYENCNPQVCLRTAKKDRIKCCVLIHFGMQLFLQSGTTPLSHLHTYHSCAVTVTYQYIVHQMAPINSAAKFRFIQSLLLRFQLLSSRMIGIQPFLCRCIRNQRPLF